MRSFLFPHGDRGGRRRRTIWEDHRAPTWGVMCGRTDVVVKLISSWRGRIAANAQLYVKEIAARTHRVRQIWGGKEGEGSGEKGERKKNLKQVSRMDTRGQRAGGRVWGVPSRGLESVPNQLQGCSRSGLELSPSELIIMKKHSARVAPLSACNSPVLTLTKVEGRESLCPFRARPHSGTPGLRPPLYRTKPQLTGRNWVKKGLIIKKKKSTEKSDCD